MDFLKAEIARKKKQLEQSKVVDPESGKQFFKRGDLMKQQEEHYWKRHKKDDGAVSEDSSRKKVRRESTELMDPNLVTLSRQEVIKRLRDRQEPIRLFGELDTEAFFRLRRYEMLAPEINKGLRNDFKEAMDKVDQQYLEEMVKLQGEDVPNRAYDIKFEDDGSTIDDIIEMSAGMGQGNDHDEQDSKVIVHYIKFLLKMWAQELNRREEHVKRSNNGRLESATYSQTKGYLQPLLRKLNKQSLAPDLLDSLVTIVRFMLDRDYVKASDTYLQMAIGNAPWPIGVTMVGIHARTGREKIFSKNVAHVLNDETQRKFIQALKRLMTQCQRHYPTVPSRSVEYVKSDIVENSH